MQSQQIMVVVLLTHVVHFVAYLGAGFYALTQRKRHPTAARYLLLAVVIMGISRILSFMTPVVVSSMVTPTQLGSLIYMLNVAYSLLNVAAFGLMVVAIFIKRVPESLHAADGEFASGAPTESSNNPYESPL